MKTAFSYSWIFYPTNPEGDLRVSWIKNSTSRKGSFLSSQQVLRLQNDIRTQTGRFLNNENSLFAKLIFWPNQPWGGVRVNFFEKKKYLQKYLKHIEVDSVFGADSEYDISFDQIVIFLTEIC